MFKKIWHDPVWSKVISAAIIAAVAAVGSYFLDWWPAIGQAASQSLSFAGSSSTIPNWLVGALALLAIPTALVGLVAAWQALFPSSTVPSWQTYTSDNFFGLVWRWRYVGGLPTGINTFCPHCDFQVFGRHASAYHVVDRTSFDCECCNRNLGSFEEPYGSLENKVVRFVQQKLRQGSWQRKDGG